MLNLLKISFNIPQNLLIARNKRSALKAQGKTIKAVVLNSTNNHLLYTSYQEYRQLPILCRQIPEDGQKVFLPK